MVSPILGLSYFDVVWSLASIWRNEACMKSPECNRNLIATSTFSRLSAHHYVIPVTPTSRIDQMVKQRLVIHMLRLTLSIPQTYCDRMTGCDRKLSKDVH